MKERLITVTAPIITGTSRLFNELTISLPKPFHPKIYSTNTEPANKLANHPDRAVTTGLREFLIQWFTTTLYLDNPFEYAVKI